MIMILSPSVGVAGRSVQPASRSHDPANARRDDGYEWALGAGQTLARGAQRRGLAHLPRRRKFFHKASGVAAAGGTFGLRAITEFSQVSRPPKHTGPAVINALLATGWRLRFAPQPHLTDAQTQQ